MEEFPTYGVPRLTVILNQRRETPINRKKVARIVRINNWQLNRRPKGHRPRVKSWSSRCEAPNQRWAVDQTHFLCGKDGWCHLTAIIDCHTRQIVGWRLSGSGKAKVAVGALEEAVRSQDLQRSHCLKLRSDNGLIFGARSFVREVRKHGIEQEFITPYTPEQNGMIERFFRSFKEECIYLHRFESRDDAFPVVAAWIDHYNQERPHSALSYLSPVEFVKKIRI